MGMKSPGSGRGQLKEKNGKTNDNYAHALGRFEVRQKRRSYLPLSYIGAVGLRKTMVSALQRQVPMLIFNPSIVENLRCPRNHVTTPRNCKT